MLAPPVDPTRGLLGGRYAMLAQGTSSGICSFHVFRQLLPESALPIGRETTSRALVFCDRLSGSFCIQKTQVAVEEGRSATTLPPVSLGTRGWKGK
jgi:hypothetical protein